MYLYNLFSIIIISMFIYALPINKSKQNILLGILLFFQFTIIAVLRHEYVGADLITYIEYFNYVSSSVITDFERKIMSFEIGYVLLNKIVSYFTSDSRILIIIIDSFIYISFCRFIVKYSKIPWLSFFMFVALGYYSHIYNIQRQFIAIAILTYSIHYALNKQFFKFILLVLLSMSIHKTAIVFLLIYPIVKIEFNIQTIIILFICICLFMYTFANVILQYFMKLLEYEAYSDVMVEDTGYGMLILLLIVVIASYALCAKYKKSNKIINLFFNILVVSLFLQVLAIKFNLFGRVVMYFAVYMIILIPNAISLIKSRDVRNVSSVIVGIFVTLYFFRYIVIENVGSGIMPYRFFWE